MGKASLIIYIAVAVVLLLLVSLNSRPHAHGGRRLKIRSNFTFAPPADHHHHHDHPAAFDPLVADIELHREDREWELQYFHNESTHPAPGHESQPEWEDFSNAEDFVNDEDRFNVTNRLVLLFPRLDVDPTDGFVSESELTQWNMQQSQREAMHRSQREMETHDKNRDGFVTFAEYKAPIWVRNADNTSFGYDFGWWKEDHFNASDADGDGRLDITEFNDFLHPADTTNPKLLMWLCKEEISERDRDIDGKLNFNEFFHGLFDLVRSYEETQNSSDESDDSLEAPAKLLFSQLDKDGNGYLSAVELLPIIGKLHPSEHHYAKQQTEYIMHQADADKDGRLTLTEMIESPYVFYTAVFNEGDEDSDYELHDEFRKKKIKILKTHPNDFTFLPNQHHSSAQILNELDRISPSANTLPPHCNRFCTLPLILRHRSAGFIYPNQNHSSYSSKSDIDLRRYSTHGDEAAIQKTQGLESIPNNSPHLRKSGSRPVVFDIGSSELGNSSEEDFSLSKESNEMKGVATPLSTAAIVPSPLLLWRFKVLLFFLWGFCCCKIGWDSVMRMSADLRDLFLYEAFLYYNPLLLVTMMVWLWGINLWVFSQANIGYVKIFDLDQSHLTHREIWKCATWMTIIVPTSMTAYLYLYSHGEVSLAASQPVLLYAAVLMTVIFPFDIFYLSSRFFFLRTVWRIVFPLQAISFADFFLADIFTSMSKVFSDLERSVCRMVHRQVATIAWFEADSVCGSHSVAIPIVLVLPYIFRFFQCLRQYKDTREKTSLLNALKYSTAVPVIFLSALKYHVFPEKWTNIYRPLWLLSSVLNSLYSFYWDISRDWDLSCFTRIFKFNKPHVVTHLLHGRKWVYVWVIGSNLILRCTWTYKLSAHLRHNYLTVFAITALEMLRRFQWVFFRVENEWNKMNSKSNIQLSMTDMPNEEEKLLNSNGHTV